jgi:hypothetical protein
MTVTTKKPLDRDQVLRRYPRIVAHLICESLGYFSPGAAANALATVRRGGPFFCEWFVSMARSWSDTDVRRVGVETLAHAISDRHRHRGYMAEYTRALRLVMAERQEAGSSGAVLMSW